MKASLGASSRSSFTGIPTNATGFGTKLVRTRWSYRSPSPSTRSTTRREEPPFMKLAMTCTTRRLDPSARCGRRTTYGATAGSAGAATTGESVTTGAPPSAGAMRVRARPPPRRSTARSSAMPNGRWRRRSPSFCHRESRTAAMARFSRWFSFERRAMVASRSCSVADSWATCARSDCSQGSSSRCAMARLNSPCASRRGRRPYARPRLGTPRA